MEYQMNKEIKAILELIHAGIDENYLKEFPNLLFCINGHAHHYQINEFFNDGVLYYQTPCAKYRGYILFTITEDGYEQELIEY